MSFIRIGPMTLNLEHVLRIVEHRRSDAQVAAGHHPTYFTVFLTSGERFQFVGGEAIALEQAMSEHVRSFEVPHELHEDTSPPAG